MQELLDTIKEIGTGELATVVGRYYAMDRDKRWERVELALKGLVLGEGEESSDPVATIKERYEKGENDEFLKPIIVGGAEARIKGKISSHPFIRKEALADPGQMVTTSFSSTTAPTVSGRSLSSLETSTAPRDPTSPTPRSTSSP